jgi:hypothetical protein
MPGTSPGSTAGNPALTLVLALFMLCYALWAADRLASRSRALDATPAAAGPAGTLVSAAPAYPGPALAPRLAGCYKIAMAITMGYMLVTMLWQ